MCRWHVRTLREHKLSQWIRIDCDMPGHPKVAEFADLVGVDEVTAFGALVRLFGWVKQYYPDGNISDVNPRLLVKAMGLTLELCAPPSDGWVAQQDALCDVNNIDEVASTSHVHLYAVACKSHVSRIQGRICDASKSHYATYNAFLVCVTSALRQARIVLENGEVSGWVERQPQKGKKRAGGMSRQALSAHKRWNHTPESPGQNCSVCASEFETNPEWRAVANSVDATGTVDRPSKVASKSHQSRINNVVDNLPKKLSLQYNTIQDNTGLMCSNEHIARAPKPPVDNPVDNSDPVFDAVANPEPSGTIIVNDEPSNADEQPNPGTDLPGGAAGRSMVAPEEPDRSDASQDGLDSRQGDVLAPGTGDGRLPLMVAVPGGMDEAVTGARTGSSQGSRPDDEPGGDAAGRAVVGNAEPEGFQEFWEQYPKRKGRRDGKRDARRNWTKLTKTQQTEAVAALREYKRSAGEYPVNASRYLGRDEAGIPFFADYLERQSGVAATSPFNGNSDKRYDIESWSRWR